MKNVSEQEYEILRILDKEENFIGSGYLCKLLNDQGINISEATVGRVLSEMDRRSLTIKYGYKGRVISSEGRQALEYIVNIKRQNMCGERILNIVNSNKKQDIIDILVARRAIERELSRLAAVNASEEEIEIMKKVLHEQEECVLKNVMTAEKNEKFHKLVERAAKNKFLAASMNLIRQGKQISYILENIRKEVKGTLAVEHTAILKEIINRNPEGAEEAMIAHIESLVSDVDKYWENKYCRDDVKKQE
ncbi:MAG: FCD domain-containing protein [Clostridiales bacterium]|nr:FCD domain-containing protein [Clostridiales bacterium]MCF8023251.1 FCD domain-containing protein [Clostridiales bacterium]